MCIRDRLYTITDVADFFDGYVARRADHVTELGSVLDMEFDGLGTMIVIPVSYTHLDVYKRQGQGHEHGAE